jgi:activator of 2-hydroxyglutaryl-CoA dehydratase
MGSFKRTYIWDIFVLHPARISPGKITPGDEEVLVDSNRPAFLHLHRETLEKLGRRSAKTREDQQNSDLGVRAGSQSTRYVTKSDQGNVLGGW